MKVGKYGTMAALAIILSISLAFAGSVGAQAKADKLSFSIVTGGTGGVWYPLGGAIGGVIGKYVPNAEASAEV